MSAFFIPPLSRSGSGTFRSVELALVVKGRGTEALLDSFNTERHANAKRLLGFVGTATKAVTLTLPVAIRLRQLAMMAVGQLGLTALAAQRIGEIDVHYRHSPWLANITEAPASGAGH